MSNLRCRIPQKPIKLGPPVPALSAADAMVPVDADHLTPHTAGDLPQFPLLILGGLVDGGNSKVKDGPFHRIPRLIDGPQI
jgi:hypothetical protein